MYFPLRTPIHLWGQKTLVAEYRGQDMLATKENLKQMVPHADTDLQHPLMACLITLCTGWDMTLCTDQLHFFRLFCSVPSACRMLPLVLYRKDFFSCWRQHRGIGRVLADVIGKIWAWMEIRQLINDTINISLNTLFALCPFTVPSIKPFIYLIGYPKPSSSTPEKQPLWRSGGCTDPAPGPNPPAVCFSPRTPELDHRASRDHRQHEANREQRTPLGAGAVRRGGHRAGSRGSSPAPPAAAPASRRAPPRREQRLPAPSRAGRAAGAQGLWKVAFLQWVCIDTGSVSLWHTSGSHSHHSQQSSGRRLS